MNYLEEKWSPDQIEKATKMHEAFKELSELQYKIEMMTLAVKQTSMMDMPQRALPQESVFPLGRLLTEGRIPQHPLYSERLNLSLLCGDVDDKVNEVIRNGDERDREEIEKEIIKEIREEIIREMSIEILLMMADAKKLMLSIQELGQEMMF